jgi:hypothetical protein
MGYPPKKRHPAARAPSAHATSPVIKYSPVFIAGFIISFFIHRKAAKDAKKTVTTSLASILDDIYYTFRGLYFIRIKWNPPEFHIDFPK